MLGGDFGIGIVGWMECRCRERWRGCYLSLGLDGNPINDLAIGLDGGLDDIESCSLVYEVLSCFNSVLTLRASFGFIVNARLRVFHRHDRRRKRCLDLYVMLG